MFIQSISQSLDRKPRQAPFSVVNFDRMSDSLASKALTIRGNSEFTKEGSLASAARCICSASDERCLAHKYDDEPFNE